MYEQFQSFSSYDFKRVTRYVRGSTLTILSYVCLIPSHWDAYYASLGGRSLFWFLPIGMRTIMPTWEGGSLSQYRKPITLRAFGIHGSTLTILSSVCLIPSHWDAYYASTGGKSLFWNKSLWSSLVPRYSEPRCIHQRSMQVSIFLQQPGSVGAAGRRTPWCGLNWIAISLCGSEFVGSWPWK